MTVQIVKYITASLTISSLALMHSAPAFAQTVEQSFSDVPPTHWAFRAAEDLKANGVFQGFADGTFKPDDPVTREQAIKVLVSTVVSQDQLSKITESGFSDVANDSWSAPYIRAALALEWIDGPPSTTAFNPTRGVNKVEFLKMLFNAWNVDSSASYSDIKGPLGQDIVDTSAWFYNFMRYAVASTITTTDTNGNLNPAQQLSRGQVAVFMHRLSMYQQSRRLQAGLSATEMSILESQQRLGEGNLTAAKAATTRARLTSRGVLDATPQGEEPSNVVKAAVKTAEAFDAIVDTYGFRQENQFEQTVEKAGVAWNLAEQIRTFADSDENLLKLAKSIQDNAKLLADDAREQIGQ